MKHHFAPWNNPTPPVGVTIAPGAVHSKCTRCAVPVRVAKGRASTEFWVEGKWTSKRPPCNPPK